MATLTLDHVSKIYPGSHDVRAVDDVTMHMNEGEIVALLGSSGCGKTSTLRMIAGFESVTKGSIRIGEREINGLPASARNVAMAFEGYALYPPLKVSDNIAFGLLRDKRPRAEIEAKVRRTAEMLEIDDILGRYPPTISGGQQQRVSLARALVRNAAVYLLDEPMSQLEPQLRAILRARIKDYLIEHRMTTVCVTHDQTEAVALSDRIAVMEKGVLQQFATPEALKERPTNLFVASFIGEPPMNLFAAVIAERAGKPVIVALDDTGAEAFTVPVPPGDAARAVLRPGREIRLGIRPHKIRIGNGAGDAAALSGTLVSNQWLGDQSHLGVTIGGCFLIAVTDRGVDIPSESDIPVRLPTDAIHIFDADSERALLHGGQPAKE